MFIVIEHQGAPGRAFSSSPIPSSTGAPALGSVSKESDCTSCHAGTVNGGGGSFTISAPATYTPNQNVSVSVTLTQTGAAFFGFELTALNDQGQKLGDLVTGDGRTMLVSGAGNFAGRQYIQHSFSGITSNAVNQNSWTFTWKAPAQNAGRVTFYASGCAANADGTKNGDLVYTASKSVNTTSTQPGQFASASAASFNQAKPLAPNGIVAGFGAGLTANTVAANTTPLPTTLDGTSVLVNGTPASLFVVSPTQINYLIPSGAANGTATVTVRRNGADTAQGAVTIDGISPGLFSANANGQGVAAALILRRRNGVDTFEPVAQFNAGANRYDPKQIDLGPTTDQVFLVLYGTGFRAAAQSAVSVTIGGTAAPVIATAAAPGFFGLDQANVMIPHSLAGSNKVLDVVLTASGKTANTVQISIK
jgi:uncharacterized protein (TIGR03437 family)